MILILKRFYDMSSIPLVHRGPPILPILLSEVEKEKQIAKRS